MMELLLARGDVVGGLLPIINDPKQPVRALVDLVEDLWRLYLRESDARA